MYVHRARDATVALMLPIISVLAQLTGAFFEPVSCAKQLITNHLSATRRRGNSNSNGNSNGNGNSSVAATVTATATATVTATATPTALPQFGTSARFYVLKKHGDLLKILGD